MANEVETSPEAADKASPAAGSAEGASPAGEPSGAAAESAPTAEEIAQFRALKQKFAEQNVDPEHLLPEFTRRSQELQQEREANRRWQEEFQRRQQAEAQRQAPAQPDAVSLLEQRLAEIGDPLSAGYDAQLARQVQVRLTQEYARRAAEEAVSQNRQQQFMEDYKGRMARAAAEFGVPEDQVPLLTQRLQQTPEALALGLAFLHNPDALPDRLDKKRKAARERAQEAAAHRPLAADTGGGKRMPGSMETEQREPLRVPSSVWFAFPEKVSRKKYGDDAVIVPG